MLCFMLTINAENIKQMFNDVSNKPNKIKQCLDFIKTEYNTIHKYTAIIDNVKEEDVTSER